jgi:hypothetical protein
VRYNEYSNAAPPRQYNKNIYNNSSSARMWPP